MLLGWNCTLHHVPGDDQQDNRQVVDGRVASSYINLVYLNGLNKNNRCLSVSVFEPALLLCRTWK